MVVGSFIIMNSLFCDDWYKTDIVITKKRRFLLLQSRGMLLDNSAGLLLQSEASITKYGGY